MQKDKQLFTSKNSLSLDQLWLSESWSTDVISWWEWWCSTSDAALSNTDSNWRILASGPLLL